MTKIKALIKNGWWLLAAVFFIFTPARAGVVINEFAYYLDPSGDAGKEWIELYNPDSIGIDLSGYDVSPNRTPHYIVPSGFVLGPRSFVLIHLRLAGVNTASDLYEGTAPTSNMPNGNASVAIFTDTTHTSGTIVDFVQYGAVNQTYESIAGTAGIWTRNDFTDTVTCTWSLGLAADGADHDTSADWAEFSKPTPGYSNSPQPYDIALETPSTSPLEIPAGSSFTVTALVKNQGVKAARNVWLTFYHDANGDSVCQTGETVFHREQWDSLPGPRVCSFTHEARPEGAYRLSVLALSDSESVLSNNRQVLDYLAGSPLEVNEIMYGPYSGQPEWVELYNRSGSPVDVCNWTFEDATASPENVTTDHRTILPGEYLLLAPDTSYFTSPCPKIELSGWPSLNGEGGDIVCLRDSRGAAADRVQYQDTWGGGEGRSLEKINPCLLSQEAANWGGCVSSGGSTPGRQNSIYIEKLGSSADLSISPNPFSPDGDGFEDHVLIGLDFAWTRAVVNIKVYDRLGRLVKNLAEQQSFGASGTVVWDGRDGGNRVCPMGVYIVLLEARDANGSGSVKKKQAVALAKKL
ncbi:MAG: lamin tail domain-containing protein [bacterium]|nr:lamin tail domain-containing protein [bacterium]